MLLQSSAFAGVFAGFTIAADFEFGFARRLLLAAPRRSGIVAATRSSRSAAASSRPCSSAAWPWPAAWRSTAAGGGFAALLLLALLVNVTATLFAAGNGAALPHHQRGPGDAGARLPDPFLAPVYVPVNLLHGWIQSVAQVNPVTPMLEAARGLISGDPASTLLAAFAIAHRPDRRLLALGRRAA